MDYPIRESSWETRSITSLAVLVFLRLSRKNLSFNRRETRASAFKCGPAESEGAIKRKKMYAGSPSRESKFTPFLLMAKAEIKSVTASDLVWGMAIP